MQKLELIRTSEFTDERHPDIKVKDIQEYLKNQEVNQINTSVNIKYEYKITAPPRTFQIDIFWWKRGDTLIPILLLVDILSRKAWAYVLTKSKKEKRAAVSVKTLQEFKDEVGLITGLEGDNEFSSAASSNRVYLYGGEIFLSPLASKICLHRTGTLTCKGIGHGLYCVVQV